MQYNLTSTCCSLLKPKMSTIAIYEITQRKNMQDNLKTSIVYKYDIIIICSNFDLPLVKGRVD